MPCDGPSPACSSRSLLDSMLERGEMAVGEVIRSIEGQASILRLSSMKRRSKETQWKFMWVVEEQHPMESSEVTEL
jgi:hypothetical protein